MNYSEGIVIKTKRSALNRRKQTIEIELNKKDKKIIDWQNKKVIVVKIQEKD